MKLTTIAEALASQEEEPVLAIRGTLSKLYDPMTGDGEHGPWSIQNGELKDEDAAIKVMFSNRDPVPKMWRGKVIELRCTKGKGWSGVKLEPDRKDNKKLVLKVTAAAEVFLFNEEKQAEGEAPKQNTHTKPPAPEPGTPLSSKLTDPPAQQGAAATAANDRPRMEIGVEKLRQIANTQYAAVIMVREYLMPLLAKRGIEIDPIGESKLVQNMLIQSFMDDYHEKYFPTKELGRKSDSGPPTNGS